MCSQKQYPISDHYSDMKWCLIKQNFNFAIVRPATNNTAKISSDDDEETTVFAYTNRVVATTKFKNWHSKAQENM